MGMRNSKFTTEVTSADGGDQKGLELLGKLFLSLKKKKKNLKQKYPSIFFLSLIFLSMSLSGIIFCTFWLDFFFHQQSMSFLTTPIRGLEEEKHKSG